MTQKHASDVLVGELASVLSDHAGLLCVPAVERTDDGHVVLTICVRPSEQETIGGAVSTLELYHQLERIIDVGTLRAISARYDIDPQQLEALLPPDGQEGV
jgi:hypothetical protein